MVKKITYLGIAVVVILIAVGFYFLKILDNTRKDPFSFIPENVTMIVQVDQPHSFVQKLNDNNEIRKSLEKSTEFKKLNKMFVRFDSIISQNKNLEKLLDGQIIACMVYDSAFNEFHYLYLLPAIDDDPERLAENLGSSFTVNPSEHYEEIFEVVSQNPDMKLFMGFTDNILLVSSQDWLIERSQKGTNPKGHFTTDKSFIQLRKTVGKNTDAKIYFNYRYLSALLGKFLREPNIDFTHDLAHFASWTETDLLLKKDELLLSGFTFAGNGEYLGRVSGDEAFPLKAGNIAPFNTCFLFAKSSSDINKLFQKNHFKKLSSSLNFDLQKLIDVLGHEITIASNASDPGLFKENTWVILPANDPVKAANYLRLISSNTGIKQGETINGHTIRQIRADHFIPDMFGAICQPLNKTWFTVLDDFVVFGNSGESLKKLIRYYDGGKTLDLNENFMEFGENISGTSNLMLYVCTPKMTPFLGEYLNDRGIDLLISNQSVINDFRELSIQFSVQDSMFYTNIYSKNSKTPVEENFDSWRVELDNKIVSKPFLVKDHTTGRYNVLVFDEESYIYLVRYDGQIAWKKKLDNLPQGDVFEVDYFKNRKIQYLFNTRDFVYLLDRNGEAVSGYPHKINPSATGPISLFDYNNKKEYRIIVPQADKRIYNYTKEWKKVEGWQTPKTPNIITEPVRRLVAGRKDYFIATDIDNNIEIFNRRGNQRLKLRKNPEKARHSDYYINKTNSKGIIITTDKYGRLTYLSTSGDIKYTEFNEFSADHYFLYEDFDANGSVDFIYLEGDQLTIFNRFKKVLFSYRFPSVITVKPEYFKVGNEGYLGVVDSDNKTIYLFDRKGNLVVSSGLSGENQFVIGSLNNDEELNLISSTGNTLYNYRIN